MNPVRHPEPFATCYSERSEDSQLTQGKLCEGSEVAGEPFPRFSGR